MKAIGERIFDKDEIVGFLKCNLRKEIYSVYYVFNTLYLLNEELPDMEEFLIQRLDEALDRNFKNFIFKKGTTFTYSFETPNVLREMYLIVSSLNLLGKRIRKVRGFIKKLRKNGGYGVSFPNIRDTYYCISILNEVDGKVLSFIRQHECREGGFAKSPGGYPPYLEETFYALKCFKIANSSYFSNKTLNYLYSLQNRDGGFRRSVHGGISTLEDTYYAVCSIKLLNQMKQNY